MNPEDENNEPRWNWSHLAVVAAVAFVLGVLVWNIARAQS